MTRSITAVLSMTDMFDNLTDTQLELVASISELSTFKMGDILFRENDRGDELYVIVRGSIDILVNPGLVGKEAALEPIVIAELKAGQVVGEVALVDQGVRSATARVGAGNTELLRLPRERLMLLCNTYPELGFKLMQNLAADLALKMRNTDLTVRQYQLKLHRQKE